MMPCSSFSKARNLRIGRILLTTTTVRLLGSKAPMRTNDFPFAKYALQPANPLQASPIGQL